ncbi:MAG: hypothetical protein QXX20_00605 [Candidatus Thermoplasmatota archaeon]
MDSLIRSWNSNVMIDLVSGIFWGSQKRSLISPQSGRSGIDSKNPVSIQRFGMSCSDSSTSRDTA